MFYLKDFYLASCDAAARLVEGYVPAAERQHAAELFDGWIRYYDLADDYPLDETLNTVWRRRFTGPIQRVSDFRARGFGDAIDKYEAASKELTPPMRKVFEPVTNLIDGKNTVGEIVRKASLEQRKDVKAQVLLLLDLYRKLGLIEEV